MHKVSAAELKSEMMAREEEEKVKKMQNQAKAQD